MIQIKYIDSLIAKRKDIGWQKMAEEQPNFVVDPIFKFFENDTNDSK